MPSSRSKTKHHEGPASDHFDGIHFFNPSRDTRKSFGKFLRWQFTFRRGFWPRWVPNQVKPSLRTRLPSGQVDITFINHSSFLIQTPRFNFLTDPIFSKRASPLSFLGPKRVHAPGVAFGQLPRIDGVLVSHNHYDHMDLPSLRKLEERDRPRFFAPLGDGVYLGCFRHLYEMDWHQVLEVEGVRIHFLPALHWSGRWTDDRYKSLWGAFLIEVEEFKIYFAGDSGYDSHFKAVAERFGPLDLSLLPIGAYEPRWFMKNSHLNPEEAVRAHLDLKSKMSLGMHFGSFRLTDESYEAPLQDLQVARQKWGLKPQDFTTLRPGESFTLSRF